MIVLALKKLLLLKIPQTAEGFLAPCHKKTPEILNEIDTLIHFYGHATSFFSESQCVFLGDCFSGSKLLKAISIATL